MSNKGFNGKKSGKAPVNTTGNKRDRFKDIQYKFLPYYGLSMTLLSVLFILDAKGSIDLLGYYWLSPEFFFTFNLDNLSFYQPIIYSFLGIYVITAYMAGKVSVGKVRKQLFAMIKSMLFFIMISWILYKLGICLENNYLNASSKYVFLWCVISNALFAFSMSARQTYIKFIASVKDPKDRYNIILIFLGFIVSLIALFK